jgi:D-glycero-beta-D-manno-heptose-7-phosphate kinase
LNKRKPSTLEKVVGRFSRQTILAAADLVADEFVFGEIARVSREAPVLILKRRESRYVPGGGANAIYNIAALGARVVPVGIVGDDEPGRALLAAFASAGISTEGILTDPQFSTTTKTRILAGTIHGSRQQVLRIDREPDRPLSAESRRWIAQTAERLSKQATSVLISDYGYGAATPALASRLRTQFAGPVTVDSRYDIPRYRGVTSATPNEPEVEEVFKTRIGTDVALLERCGRTLLRRMKLQALLVTRGRDGMALFEPNRPTLHIPIHGGSENTDVTGAGDTVIAAFTLALAAGADFASAARLANYAGGIVVMKPGTATASARELLDALQGAPSK